MSPRGNVAGGDPSSFTTRFTRDADGRVTSVTDPLNHVTRYQPDANGNLLTITDPRGNPTTYAYNGDNQPTTELRADGVTITTAYYPNGQVESRTSSASGTLASYTYNAREELRTATTPPTATNPAGITTSYTYDPAGHLQTVTQPGANGSVVTTNHYDPAGRLHTVSYSDNTPGVTYGYDAAGRRTSMSDGTGNSSYTYNLSGWLTSTTNGAGQTTGYTYDLDGNPTTIAYPNGRSVIRSYNNDNRLNAVTDWHGKTTSFGYDPNGNLETALYPNGVTETSTYLADDSMKSLADVEGTSTTLARYDYSNRNENAALTGAGASGSNVGASETYGYNNLNQLDNYTTTAPGGSSGTLSYNANGDLTGLPGGTTLSYDPADELTHTANPNGISVDYAYDPRGDRTNIIPNSGPAAALSYNAANELTGFGTPSLSSTYSYDGDGLRASKTVGLSTRRFSYDPVSGYVPLITSDSRENYIYGPNETPIEQIGTSTPITFIYGTANTDNAAGVSNTLSLTYATKPQPNDQILIIVNENNGTNLTSAPSGYTMVGTFPTPNSIEKTVILRRTATDTGGGGTSDPDVGVSLSFAVGAPHPATATAVIYRGVDPNNPIEGTPQSANAAGASSVAVPSVTTATDDDQLVLVEDALNTPPTTTWTAPDSTWTSRPTAAISGPLVSSAVADKPVVFAPTTTPTGSSATTSLPGQLEDVLLVLRHPNAVQYIQHDQLGSTRLLTDPQGNVTGSYSYTPYGATISHTGSDSTSLQFNSQYQDSENGLYYLRARYYDPATATFLTRDPIESISKQPYQYANGDPLDQVDPLGLWGWNPISDLTQAAGDTVNAVGDAVNAALPIVHELANVVATAASLCAMATLNPACGAIALAAGGVTAASGGILYAEGRESGLDFGLDVIGFGLGGLSSAADAGAAAGEAWAASAEGGAAFMDIFRTEIGGAFASGLPWLSRALSTEAFAIGGFTQFGDPCVKRGP